MKFTLLLLTTCLFAGLAAAQDVQIEVQAGVGGVVAGPHTEIRVLVRKNSQAPLVGRIVIDSGTDHESVRHRFQLSPRTEAAINLEQGRVVREFRFNMPVPHGFLQNRVRVDAQTAEGLWNTVAESGIAANISADNYVAYVSDVSLAAATPFFREKLVALSVADLPESWKPLSGFRAVIVNDDRLSRTQATALLDYMATGGTVIVSPRGAGSFREDLPAGRILGTRQAPGLARANLSGYEFLLARPVTVAPLDENGEDDLLFYPDPDSSLTFFEVTSAGRSSADSQGLISVHPVGGGTLVMLRVNLSDSPFSIGARPAVPAVNLLLKALEEVPPGALLAPQRLLAEDGVVTYMDIAGRKIPGAPAISLMLLIYISVAGVGMFLLARRVRRPELFPAALMIAAVLSIALVFSVGEAIKRTGDRAVAVRMILVDGTSEHGLVTSLGCVYAVNGGEMTLTAGSDALLRPLDRPSRGGAYIYSESDMLLAEPPHEVQLTGAGTLTKVKNLSRWQNVYYLHQQPRSGLDFKVRVESMDGAWRIHNETGRPLRGVLLYVADTSATAGESHRLFYLAGLEVGESASISSAEELTSDMMTSVFRDMLGAGVQRDLYDAVLGINPADPRHSRRVDGFSRPLVRAGLVPRRGEFSLFAFLPEETLPVDVPEVENLAPDRRRQQILLAVRGGLE